MIQASGPDLDEMRDARRLEPRALRILMTVDAAGGVWEYALQLAEALAPYGAQFILASMGPPPDLSQRARVRALGNATLWESSYKLEWMDQPWDDVDAAGRWLRDIESRTCPSIIHLNGYCHAVLPWSAPCLVVAHSCVYSWFAAVRRQPPGPEWEEYRRRVCAGLRAASAVIAPSAAMLAALKAHYGVFNDAGAIYNGRAGGGFCSCPKESIVLTAGRLWDEAKNIAALARLPRAARWPIYAAGDSTSPDHHTGELPGLRLLGRLSRADLDGWLERAAVFALPARYEPFGLAALEAALAGCALLLGDIPSLREIWRDAALFVSPEDNDALGDALDLITSDERLRALMSARARRRAREFSVQRMATEYMRLYRRLRAAKDVQSSKACPEQLVEGFKVQG
jgi:glycosyltransferase involved in cell wall biosynthesis